MRLISQTYLNCATKMDGIGMGDRGGAKLFLTPKPLCAYYARIKATAPLLAAMQERVIRWLFFCPACPAVAQGGGF